MVYIKREIEDQIISFLDSEEIIAVMGARQVGKTTLIEKILETQKNKKIKKITFDNINILNQFINQTQEFIENYIENTDILFIDEVHYAKDSGKILKYIYDKYKTKTKIIITSSSSVDLSIQSLKYLVGRVINFELYPFSFYEFLLTKQENLAKTYKKSNISKETYEILKPYLNEYLKFGGYPKVVLEKNKENKKKILENITYTYTLKDIKSISNFSEDFKLNNLLKALALQIGNIVKYKELTEITNISHIELKKILNILNKTYICKEINPYFKNKRTEINKSKKIYFYDLGIRNTIINNYSIEGKDIGFIKENFIFKELTKNNIETKYWRTEKGSEVDFIIEKGYDIYSIEVKNNLKKENITKSYLFFLKKYKPKKAYIFTNYLNSKKDYDNNKVYFNSFINIFEFIKNIKE